VKRIVIGIIILLLLWIYSNDNIVAQVIAGEACGEGYKGMYAVACVIQNRAKLTNKSPSQIVTKKYQFASLHNPKLKVLYYSVKPIANLLAYRIGTLKDITKGATLFENIERFGKPSWYNKVIKTCKIGRHTFFKEKEN